MKKAKKIIKRILKNPYNWVIIGLGVINVLPILAPIFMQWGWDFPAKVIYFIYSFTCHQFAHRSLHIHDHQCAWCSRDMAIWGAILIVAIFIKKFKVTKNMQWYWIFPFVIPIALDGGIQTIATMLGINPNNINGDPYYISTNIMRVITGSIFGTGLGLLLLPPLYDSFHNVSKDLRYKFKSVPWKIVAMSVSSILVAYIFMIGIWEITSEEVKPANIIDFQVKTPTNDEFFVRRENGICPVDALSSDPLGTDCFF